MPSKSKNTCKGCDQPPTTKKGWCSVECYRKNQAQNGTNPGWFTKGELVNRVVSTCLECGSDIRDRYKRSFCSNKCAIKYRKINTPNGNPKPINRCSNCNRSVKKKIGKSGHVYCSRSCYNEYRSNNKVPTRTRVERVKKICGICKSEFSVYPCREHTAKYCSKSCLGVAGMLSQTREMTNIEQIVRDILIENDVVFKPQYPIRVQEYITVVDFFVEPNTVLYCDGDYWHSRPEVRGRDAFFNKGLVEQGFDVIRFTGSEIINERTDVARRICEI